MSDNFFNQLAVDRSIYLTKLRRIFEAGKRLAFVEGEFGAGKTTLVFMFVEQHADLFPGGTAHIYGENLREGELDILSLLPGVLTSPALLIVDELERFQNLFPTLRQAIHQYPHLRLLAVSRSVRPLDGISDDIVSLPGLTEGEVRELLLRRLLSLDKENAERLLNTLMLHPSMANASGKTPREIVAEASKILAKGFRQSGLFGLDGQPLPANSKEYRRIITDISEVNDSLLRRLRQNPNLLRSLQPRKFEEVVAELLTRMGYEITLTPASKDGGFDMYAAKREEVGQFLYLVECKRYVPPTKVGVEIIRSLHGTVYAERATAGLLVTTSYFTSGAEAFQKKNKYLIQLHDYLAVQKWLLTATKGNDLTDI